MNVILKSLQHNILGQTCARAISLLLCLYFLKNVNNDILGLVNVRLMLLYDTILFLTREPIRKANTADSSISQFVNVVWLSPLICLLTSIVCVSLWTIGSSSSVPLWVLLCFPLSSLIESMAEPFVVFSLRFSIGSHFAVSQALLVVLKRIVAFVLIIFSGNTMYHLDIFAIAQVAASLLYLLYNVFKFYQFSKQKLPELSQFQNFRSFFPAPKEGISQKVCVQIISGYPNVLVRFLIPNMSNFIMTFTDMMSLQEIGIYDAVERLGGFFTRTLLAPLEDMSYTWSAKKEKLSNKLTGTLPSFLRLSTYVGVVASILGFMFSIVLLSVYEMNNILSGPFLLSFYSFFSLICSFSSILQHFDNLTTNEKEIKAETIILPLLTHIGLNIIFCYKFHAAGFILANSINMMVRICYSWRHISKYLGQSTPSIIDDLLPKSDVLVSLLLSIFGTIVSFMIFGTTHLLLQISIGFTMISLLAYHIYSTDLFVRGFFCKKK